MDDITPAERKEAEQKVRKHEAEIARHKRPTSKFMTAKEMIKTTAIHRPAVGGGAG